MAGFAPSVFPGFVSTLGRGCCFDLRLLVAVSFPDLLDLFLVFPLDLSDLLIHVGLLGPALQPAVLGLALGNQARRRCLHEIHLTAFGDAEMLCQDIPGLRQKSRQDGPGFWILERLERSPSQEQGVALQRSCTPSPGDHRRSGGVCGRCRARTNRFCG